jgi:GAF domain-containing protein
MSDEEDLRSAVAAGALGGKEMQAALLRSISEVARAIFAAQGSSILLHDSQRRTLVFAAVAGEGSDRLVGHSIPDSTGIAGWVLAAREPIVLEDVAGDPRFARDTAEELGYVPRGLMAVPLLLEDRALGVLEVLDRPEQSKFTLPEIELLGHFAHQAALAVALAQGAQEATAVLDHGDSDLSELAALAEELAHMDDDRRQHALVLIGALRALLEQPS